MNKLRKKIFLFATYLAIITNIEGCSKEKQNQHLDNDKQITNENKSKSTYNDNQINEVNEEKIIEENKVTEPKKFETPKKEKIKIVQIKNNDELRKYLGYNEITFEEVRNAIRNNQNISENYKNRINEFVNKLEEKTPFIDLICLYENIKLLKIEEISSEEMTNRKTSNTSAYFEAEKHTITVLKNQDSEYFDHELIHMFNYLFLRLDNYIIIKNFYDITNNIGKAFNEGFTEWLRLYLFSSNSCSYYEQVKDIDIVKYILKENTQELITDFTEYNYDNLFNKLTHYIDSNQVKELFTICEKERKERINDNQKNLLSEQEIENKYNILIQALITSCNGILNKNDVFEIQTLLYNFYNYYADHIYIANSQNNIVESLKDNYLRILLNYGESLNNNINIDAGEGEFINYYDLNGLYLGYKQESESIFDIAIVEEYRDSNNNIKDYIISASTNDLSEHQFIAISNIIEHMNIENNYVTVKELFYQYYDWCISNQIPEEESKIYTYNK